MSAFQPFAFIPRVWHGRKVIPTGKSASQRAPVRETASKPAQEEVLPISADGGKASEFGPAFLPRIVTTREVMPCPAQDFSRVRDPQEERRLQQSLEDELA